MTHKLLHLDDLDRIEAGGAGWWRPIRRALGMTSFGVNAYTADAQGDELIETHDENSVGAGRHEELYVVLTGEAAFTVDGEAVAAPAGTMLLVQPGTRRGATAAAPGTTVLVIGGKPGAALPVSPYEYWYAAEPAYAAGDYARAVEIASEGLADHPDNASLRYQLACYEALAGHREAAIEHLKLAYAGNPADAGMGGAATRTSNRSATTRRWPDAQPRRAAPVERGMALAARPHAARVRAPRPRRRGALEVLHPRRRDASRPPPARSADRQARPQAAHAGDPPRGGDGVLGADRQAQDGSSSSRTSAST